MAEIKKIKVGNTDYDIHASTADCASQLIVTSTSYGTTDPNTAGISGVNGQIYLMIIE